MANADWTVFHWLNGQAGQHGWLDDLGKFAASQMATAIVATLIAGWLLAAGLRVWRTRRLPRGLIIVVLITGVSLAIGLGINQLIGQFWFRPRPYAPHDAARLITTASSDPSFPSDHATAGFALSFGAAGQLPRLAVVLLVETLLMSLGRVYVGLHYPGDMLGSLLVGGSTALIVSWVAARGAGLVERVVVLVNGYAERRRWPVRLR